MDNIIIKYLRVLMQCKASVDGGEGSHGVSLTNVQVIQTRQVCPVELELACRRIRWVHSTVENPEEHARVIALMWGHDEGGPSA